MRHRHIALANMLVVLLAVPVFADQEHKPEQLEHWFRELKEEVLGRVHEMIKQTARPQPVKPLGKTLQLNFKLVPVEDKDKPLSVSVATTEYGIHAQVASKNSSFKFGVEGKLTLVGEKQEKVGITFHTTLEFEQDGNAAHVSARGSAIVPIGPSATLAQLGEKSLVVTVTEIQ